MCRRHAQRVQRLGGEGARVGVGAREGDRVGGRARHRGVGTERRPATVGALLVGQPRAARRVVDAHAVQRQQREPLAERAVEGGGLRAEEPTRLLGGLEARDEVGATEVRGVVARGQGVEDEVGERPGLVDAARHHVVVDVGGEVALHGVDLWLGNADRGERQQALGGEAEVGRGGRGREGQEPVGLHLCGEPGCGCRAGARGDGGSCLGVTGGRGSRDDRQQRQPSDGQEGEVLAHGVSSFLFVPGEQVDGPAAQDTPLSASLDGGGVGTPDGYPGSQETGPCLRLRVSAGLRPDFPHHDVDCLTSRGRP